MMYPYIAFPDGLEVTHSQILDDGGMETMEVHFERPSEHGFQSARCSLPSYRWLFNEGFSKDELQAFHEFLERNAHNLFRFATERGGYSA